MTLIQKSVYMTKEAFALADAIVAEMKTTQPGASRNQLLTTALLQKASREYPALYEQFLTAAKAAAEA